MNFHVVLVFKSGNLELSADDPRCECDMPDQVTASKTCQDDTITNTGAPLTKSGAKVGGGECSEAGFVMTRAGLWMVIRRCLAAKVRLPY